MEELSQRDDPKECKKTLKVTELGESDNIRGCKQLKLNDEIISALRKTFAPLKFEKEDSAGSQFLKQAKEAKLPLEITVERLFQDSQSQTHDQQKAHDNCAVGICYRLPMNYLFTASFFDGTVKRVTFAVPNGSRTYATAINRGLFTTWDTKTTLVNGMLGSYMVTTEGSELEEFAKLPTEIVGGLIEGITQKGKLFDAQSTRIASELKLLEEREKLKKAREDKPKPESSVSDRSFFTLLAGPPAAPKTDRPVQTGPDPSRAGSGGRVSSGNPGTAEGGLIPKAK